MVEEAQASRLRGLSALKGGHLADSDAVLGDFKSRVENEPAMSVIVGHPR